MNIEKRRAEIAARKAEIRKLLTDDKNADIDALEKELRELNEEDAGLEKRQAIERMLNSGSAMGNPIENPVAARSLPVEDTEKLYRSAWLKTLQGKSLTDDEKRVYEQRAYSTAANSALPIIPETTANQIIKKMYEVAPILQRCKIFHVPGNFKFAVEGTNSDAALHTENASITAASDSLTSVSLTGYEIVKLVKASRASSEMALSAFESYIVEVIAESIARKIENYIFTGTGSDQPGGVKVAGKGTSGAYTDGTDQVTVAKTASLTEENVVSLYGLLREGDIERYRAVPAWLDLALLSAQTPLEPALEPCMDVRQLAVQRILQRQEAEAVRLMPNAYTHLMLGIADYNAGSYSAAVDALQTAYDLAGREGAVRLMLEAKLFLGNAYCNRQDLPNMERHYRVGRRLAEDLQDESALRAIGYNTASAWIETGRYEEAYAWFSGQEQPTLMALHKLAICCEKTGRREEALRALTRAEAMDIDEIDRALALRLLRLVRYRLEHPDYLTRNEYGTLLLDSFDRLRNELPLGYALFHLPWMLEWYKATRQYKKACELLEAYFPEKPL